jgi:glutaredoxin
MADAIERIRTGDQQRQDRHFHERQPQLSAMRILGRDGRSFSTSWGVPYSTVDVLADQEVRDAVKTYSNWPTIPQVFINGKFVGGCDHRARTAFERRIGDAGEVRSGRERSPVTNTGIPACPERDDAQLAVTTSCASRLPVVGLPLFVLPSLLSSNR